MLSRLTSESVVKPSTRQSAHALLTPLSIRPYKCYSSAVEDGPMSTVSRSTCSNNGCATSRYTVLLPSFCRSSVALLPFFSLTRGHWEGNRYTTVHRNLGQAQVCEGSRKRGRKPDKQNSHRGMADKSQTSMQHLNVDCTIYVLVHEQNNVLVYKGSKAS